MKVIEIFASIEGEGKRAGAPCTFVRFAGCNLRCSYCDTKYSYGEGENPIVPEEMSCEQIEDKVAALDVDCVTLTGGEPLIQAEIGKLVNDLVEQGFEVNIETNGTCSLLSGLNFLRYPDSDSLFYTMDYKCFSSGIDPKLMNMDAMNRLKPTDVLKFVVGSEADMDQARDVIGQLDSWPQIYFSPIFGAIEPKAIVEYVLRNKLDVKVQIQLHKIIWAPEERGV